MRQFAGKEHLVPALSPSPDINNVKKVNLEVHSDPVVARDMISKLDLSEINNMIREW